MATSLDWDGQSRLERVLELAQGDINKVPNAVREALKGVPPGGRRVYLHNELNRRAKRKIRETQGLVRNNIAGPKPYRFKPSDYLDAYRHERDLTRGIPEEDR